jgi:hypothetical protein
MLKEYDHEIVPVGIKKGTVYGIDILPIDQHPIIKDVNTITLYIGTRHQPMYYEYLLSLKPKRIIFNPGTENSEFEKWLKNQGRRLFRLAHWFSYDPDNIKTRLLWITGDSTNAYYPPFAILFFHNSDLRSFIAINFVINFLGVAYIGASAINADT